VLIAERHRHAADFAEDVLSSNGYDVVTVFDVETAERRFNSERFDAAIVELLISGGVGSALAEHIRRNDVPVVVVSVADGRRLPTEHGGDCFLSKPLQPEELLSRLEGMLR
jgi:DNA-binding response OmpR family regulator